MTINSSEPALIEIRIESSRVDGERETLDFDWTGLVEINTRFVISPCPVSSLALSLACSLTDPAATSIRKRESQLAPIGSDSFNF